LGNLGTQGNKLLICGPERGLDLSWQVEHQDRLIDLHSVCTSLFELYEELFVNRQKLFQKRNGLNSLSTIGLGKSEEGHPPDEDWTSMEPGLLSFEIIRNWLRVGRQLESLIVLESGLDIVVVGVKPLDHLLQYV